MWNYLYKDLICIVLFLCQIHYNKVRHYQVMGQNMHVYVVPYHFHNWQNILSSYPTLPTDHPLKFINRPYSLWRVSLMCNVKCSTLPEHTVYVFVRTHVVHDFVLVFIFTCMFDLLFVKSGFPFYLLVPAGIGTRWVFTFQWLMCFNIVLKQNTIDGTVNDI